MPRILVAGATIQCSHRGTAEIRNGDPRLAVGGHGAVTFGMEVGIAFPNCQMKSPGGGPSPCTGTMPAAAGRSSLLSVGGIPVLLDGGQATGTALDHGGGIAATRGYMLNTNYLFWSVHSQTNMVPMDERMAVAQDATVVPLLFAGNLTMSNASLQGVLV